MIVDTHYHFIPFSGGTKLPQGLIDNWYNAGDCSGIKKSKEEVTSLYNDYVDDPDFSKIIRRMNEGGIDVTVVLLVDNVNYGYSSESLKKVHERFSKTIARHPGRLIPMASVDPRRPDAPALFRTFVTEFKMKGLKWHTGAGFYPNTQEAYAVLKVADELGVPLLAHTGPLPEYAAKYSQVIHLDDIAHDFPNLKIIAAHMGFGFWRDWLAIATYKKNIYGDLAGWQLNAESKPHLFRRDLREILDTVGPERLLFSSDGPILEPFVSNQHAVNLMKALTRKDKNDIRFSKEEVTAMLGGNAARIFGLT